MSAIITPTGRPTKGATRTKFLYKLLGEQVTGQQEEQFKGNFWTERGLDLEDEAAAAFRFQTDLEPAKIGLIYKDASKRAACSPDWLVADDAGAELKCPMAKNHLQALLTAQVPPEYLPQIQFSLWVSGRKRWYYISYHDSSLPIFIKTVEPDTKWQAAFSEHVPAFLDELAEAKSALTRLQS